MKKAARVERGIYLCAGYKTKAHKVPASLPPPKGKKRRVDNAVVDHVIPVGGPDDLGGWNGVVERMFCPASGLQVLCSACHSAKTADEREQRKSKH